MEIHNIFMSGFFCFFAVFVFLTNMFFRILIFRVKKDV